MVGLLGCTTQKDTVLNREYHALNTKFNVLFNGKEALSLGEAILNQNHQDNFLAVLPVEPLVLKGENLQESGSIPSFAIAEEKAVKAIQKHSMNIKGEQKNPQIEQAYFLLGKARYYDRRFFPALEAFTFLMDEYRGKAIYDQGRLWREKTNLRLGNTAIALENLLLLNERIKEDNSLYPEVQATIAQACLDEERFDSALLYITQAAKSEKKKDKKARYTYIQAQLQEQLGMEEEARKSFESIVSKKRKVPRIFWMQAKLQAERLAALQSGTSPMDALEYLSRQYENEVFLHLIRQAQARYLIGQQNDSLALDYYNKSLRSPYVDATTAAANYRELADYFFLEGAYVTAGGYLDSLLIQLPEGRTQQRTQRERNGLDEVIRLENSRSRNDSIVMLTKMSKTEQKAFFEAEIDKKRKKELAAVATEKKALFGFGNKASSNFYFYNDRLLVAGRQEFLSTWGNRPNIDRWNRLSIVNSTIEQGQTNTIEEEEKQQFFIETPDYFLSQIPTDSEAIDSLKQAYLQATLDVGILYKEKFENSDLALNRFSIVLQENPSKAQEVAALYHAYKLVEKSNPQEATEIKNQLLQKHPESPFARIISDPENYALANNQSPDRLYQKLLSLFDKQQFSLLKEEAETLKIVASGTPLLPKIDFLLARVEGRLYGQDSLLQSLKTLTEKYPNDRIIPKVKAYAEALQKEFDSSEEGSFKWIFAYATDKALEELPNAMKMLFSDREKRALKISRDVYNEEIQFVVIHSPYKITNKAYYLVLWDEIPQFNTYSNNFVLLGGQYEQIQRFKSWNLNTNEK